jgi:hypothetical protein
VLVLIGSVVATKVRKPSQLENWKQLFYTTKANISDTINKDSHIGKC